MECPKCGYSQPEGLTECQRCGLIFAKYRPVSERSAVSTSHTGTTTLGDLLWTAPSVDEPLFFWGRTLLLGGLLFLSLPLIFSIPASNMAGESFLHLVNLPFHEAGHFFFRPFGQFMMTLGGSLGQLLIPLICLGALLLKTRDGFGAAVCFWWFGESVLDLAPYINDARAGVLPLLGGNTGRNSPYGFHDWEYLLTETGLLTWDHGLAWTAHIFGSIVMMLAMAWGGILLWRGYRAKIG